MNTLIVLDEAAIKRLKKAVDTDLAILVCIGDWLAHLNIFSDAQIYDILRFIKPEIERFEFETSRHIDRRAVTLAVCDSRWVSFTGIPVFLDTETAEYVNDLDEFAVTHIICDIAALRRRMIYREELFNARGTTSSIENSSAPDETVK